MTFNEHNLKYILSLQCDKKPESFENDVDDKQQKYRHSANDY